MFSEIITRKSFLMSFIITFLIFFSCSTKPSVIATDADNNGKIEVKKDSIFAVKLKAQLGTGYCWKIVSLSREFELLGEPEVLTSEKEEPGGANFQLFKFKAIGKGEAVLRFNYVQPWKENPVSTKFFSISISVIDVK